MVHFSSMSASLLRHIAEPNVGLDEARLSYRYSETTDIAVLVRQHGFLEGGNTAAGKSECQRAEDAISLVLSERHKAGISYTRIGDKALISIQPQTIDKSTYESQSKDHALKLNSFSNFKHTFNGVQRLDGGSDAFSQPHLFDLASSAYIHLLNDKQDQCIILW